MPSRTPKSRKAMAIDRDVKMVLKRFLHSPLHINMKYFMLSLRPLPVSRPHATFALCRPIGARLLSANIETAGQTG
jgi:hypothetical protein